MSDAASLAARGALAVAATIVALLAIAPRASAATCDTSWTGAASGDWSDPLNWDAGVPDATKAACVVAAGTYTLTIGAGDAAAGSLTLGGDTGTPTLALAGGAVLTVAGTFTQAGGTLASLGTVQVIGGAFRHTGGDATGDPIQLCDAHLSATGPGTAAFAFVRLPAAGCSGGTLDSDIGAHDSVELSNADARGAMVVLVAADVTNHGTLVLDGDGSEELGGTATVTNEGTIRVAGGGSRVWEPSVVNDASIAIEADTCSCSSGAWTNRGGLTVAANRTLTLAGGTPGSAFTQAGGTLADAGGVQVLRGSFDHTGGAVTGNPVVLCGVRLDASGPGAAAFEFVRLAGPGCSGGSLAGDIGADDTVLLRNDDLTAPMVVNLEADLVNAGALELDGAGEDQLLGGAELTNDGTLTVAGAGARQLELSLVNAAAGTVAIGGGGACRCAVGEWRNSGAFSIAAGATVALQGDFHQLDGTLTDAGALDVTGDIEHAGGATALPGTLSAGGAVALNGGSLTGGGTLAAGQGVANSGATVRPNGILSVEGAYAQSGQGTLEAAVTGSGYSRLTVSGTAALSGALRVTTIGFPPGAPRIVTAGSLTGTFASVLYVGRTYTVGYDATGAVLTPTPVPVSTAAPAISGSAAVGEEIVCSQGAWDGAPSTFDYRWRRDGAALAGAIAPVYRIVADDAGHALSCTVTATNQGGPGSADSAALAIPAPPAVRQPAPVTPPGSTAPPTIAGTAAVGRALSCLPGRWSGSPATFAYRWARDGAPIGGATAATYTVHATDAGHALTCAVTASTAAGAASAVSAALRIPANCVAPKLAGKTLGVARTALTRAHCKLGKVTRPRHGARLVVRSQAPKAGTVRAGGTAVAVTLKAR
jgi:hypothetical protein